MSGDVMIKNLYTEGIKLNVLSKINIDNQEIRDIKGMKNINFIPTYKLILISLLLIICTLIVLYLWIKKRNIYLRDNFIKDNYNSTSLQIYTNKIGDYFEYKQKRRAHLVINTSCEHMQNMNAMKDYYFNNDRTLLVLQSNNKRDEPDHINCVDGCEELAEQAGITIKSGAQKTMKTRKQHGHEWDYYNRFMVLGKWE